MNLKTAENPTWSDPLAAGAGVFARRGPRRTVRQCLRATGRVLWLAAEIALAWMDFVGMVLTRARFPDRRLRAQWLQRTCRRALRVLAVDSSVSGRVPASGLLVCNHLSYLDILLLGATAPCVFVSKSEVRLWPVFGWFASLAGTLFLRRDKRSDVARMNRAMREALDSGALVVLFPEGTSSDGREVLPFKSSLLQSATQTSHPLFAGYLEYALDHGSVADEVCYWRDMTLVPHLFNLLGKRGVRARLSLSMVRGGRSDRKQLARQLHSEVVGLSRKRLRVEG